jgi:hypothetical protein
MRHHQQSSADMQCKKNGDARPEQLVHLMF